MSQMINKGSILCLLLYTSCGFAWGQKNPCNPSGAPYTSLPGDTTITLRSGSTLTFNRCEFFDMRDCMQIIEITDSADLRREGLNMYDKEGNILITCGMIKIDMKDCEKKCFDVPVKLRIKIRFQDCTGVTDAIPALYLNDGTGWERPKAIESKITKINNERYLEFETRCGIFINCDLPKKGRKVKFIAPKGNKIQQLRLGINCPLYYYDNKPERPKRKVKIRILCSNPDNIMLQAVQANPDNKIIAIPSSKLSSLKHGKARVNCKKSGSFFSNLFSWLAPRKGNFHKKYYLPAIKQ